MGTLLPLARGGEERNAVPVGQPEIENGGVIRDSSQRGAPLRAGAHRVDDEARTRQGSGQELDDTDLVLDEQQAQLTCSRDAGIAARRTEVRHTIFNAALRRKRFARLCVGNAGIILP